MTRKIYLNGEMANKFGTVHPFVGDTVQDAVRLLSANNSEFKPYLINCMENDIQFSVAVHGQELTDIKECLLPLTEGDIIITPIPAGSKSGEAKILTAMAIAALMFIPVFGPTMAQMAVGPMQAQSLFALSQATGGLAAAAGMAGVAIAANLAINGIQQIMAPDPSVDDDEEQGYMLSGSQKNAVEGDPVPVLYGELRVPGTPVSFEVSNTQYKMQSESVTAAGGLQSMITAAGFRDDPSQPGRMKLHPEDLATLTSVGPESETTTMYKTLNSFGKNQDICVTDVISEGPILGLVNNNNSVYLNDVPAVDLGNAAVTRASTGAKFYLQQNNTQVTYKPNGQAALPPSDGVNDRWLDIKDYKTQESASVVIKEVAVGYPVNSVIVTTDTAFFPTTNAEKASWVFNGNSELQNAVTHLSIGGNITDWHIPSLGTLVGTGDDAVGVSAFLSSTRCIFMSKSYKIPNSIKQNIKNGDDFKVHVDYAQSFKTMTGNTITLNTVFLGTTGDYAANITGTDRDIIEVHRGIGSSIKYDGFRCNFKTGHLDQEFFPAPAGTGMGNIALPGGVSNEAIAGPLDGATDSVKTFTGTNSGHFALSDSQAREADEIRILFTYGSLTNTSAKGTDHDGKAFYKMRIRLKHGSAYGNWQNIHTLEAPLRHIGFSRSAVSIEEILVLRDYGTNFSDFQVEITRLSEIDRAYYTTFSKPYNADYTSATPCTIVSLNTIIKENLSYPYTAMAQVGINTKAFRTVPKRTYHLKGLLVKVPSNYVTRDETSDSDGGANYRRVDKDTIHASEYQNWDGAFREESVYTNNPAWIFYDIITNNRYGLGAWLTATDIDKYALYRIGRYCDEMVPDGNGGLEPRFTTNVYFQKATDAYKVLKDLSTVFRGMLYWLDGNIFPIMDEPKNPVYNFTTGNVIDGLFSYQSTGSKTRTNQTVVTWINPEQDYKQEALLVEDKENIIETGKIISENAVAFGAVTEGQATRYGRWKVWTAKNQTEIVSFKTALGAAFLAPGDVVNIQDANRASSQLQYSGRVSSASTPSTTVIPLDRAVSLNSGSTYELSVLIEKPGVFLTQNDSATIEGVVYNKGDLILGTYTESQASDIIQTNGSSAPILSGGLEQPVTTAWQPYTRVETQAVHASSIAASPTSSITVQAAFSEEPNIQTIWALKEVNAAGVEVSGSKKPYKILSISEGKNEYDITAVEHYNDKFVEVDEDFTHSVGDTVYPSITASDTVPPPGVFYASTRNINDSGEIADDVILFWDAPTNPGKSVGDVGYLYEHVKGYQLEHDGATITLPRTSTSFTGLDIPAGTYTLGLRTLSTIDSISLPATVTITIEEADPEAIPRYAGMPIGGVLSRDIDLVATTSPTAKTFKILNAAYKFSSAASPLSLTERSGGAVTTYQQDCTNITTVNYAGLSSDFERQVAAHYIFFDSSDTSDTLKLIKYHRDSNLNENYFYDAGTGSGTAASNFNAAGTGTITLAANSIKVIGASTAFETDYNVGEIIYFNSTQAARIAHIASNTDIRLDKSFTTAIAAGSSHYPQKFKFDKKFDAAIATIRNNNGTFEMIPAKLTINKDLNDSPRVVIISADPTSLAFDGEDPPVLKTGQDDTITLTVDAQGFQNPEFKITGAGFGHTDISQSAETSFTNNGATTYSKALSAISTHSDTNLVFTATVRETDDPENSAKQGASTLTVSFLKDGVAGEDGGTGGTGPTGPTGPAGLATGTPSLFQVNSSNSTPPADPNGDLTYTFATGVVSGSNFNGWSNTRPDTTDTNPYRWVIMGPASSSGASDTITSGDWAGAVLDNAEGYQSATVYLYQRDNNSVSSPAEPDNNITYTFSDQSLSGDLDGWSQTIPSTGDYIHVITAIALAVNSDTTDVIDPADWSDAVVLAQKGDQADGYIELNIYKRAATNPGTPTGGSYNFTTKTFTRPSGWTTYIPDDTDPAWISTGVAEMPGSTGTDTTLGWSASTKISGSAGPRTSTGYVHYNTHGTPAAEPGASVTATYNYSTGVVGNMTTNWQNSPPIYTSPNEDYYYASYTVTEDEYNGTATVSFGTAAIGMGFSTLVTFTTSQPGGSFSHIDGGYISTDIVQSHNYTFPSGTENDPDGYSNSGMKIDLRTGKKGIRSPAFYIDAENGDAKFKGTIDGADGVFKGSLLVGTGADQFNVNTTGIYLGSSVFNDAEFSVNPAGSLKSTSGNIGGWTINGTSISGGSGASAISLAPTTGITLGSANDIFKATSAGIQLGHGTFLSAPFRVTPAGALTATNATITGAITATSGSFTGTVETASVIKASKIDLSGDDSVVMGDSASITLGTAAGGLGSAYTCVIGVKDGGIDNDDAAIIAIGQSIGIGGRPGVYGDDGGVTHWGWLGREAGLFGSSLKLHGWSAPLSHSTANESKYLKGDGTWDTPSGSGGSGDITGVSVTAGTGLTGTVATTTGQHTQTLAVSGLTVSQLAGGSLQTSGESFSNNDTSLMTSAAIEDKILSYGYGSGGGTYTAGTNVQISGSNVISSTDTNTTYQAGTGMSLSGTQFNCTVTNTDTTYTAGTNVQISGSNVISSTDTNTTYVASDFSHNSLSGVSAAEHINWTASGAGTIHSSNYTNTTYLGGAGMALSGTTFNIGGGTGINVAADQIAVDMGDFDTDNLSQGSTNKYYSDTLVNTRLAGSISTGAITCSSTILASGNITAFSDIRLKSEVKTIENGLDKVSKMRGVTYTKDFEPGAGVIAQELEKIAPELVQDGKFKSVAYGNIVAYLIEAVKELKEKVEELENGKSSK